MKNIMGNVGVYAVEGERRNLGFVGKLILWLIKSEKMWKTLALIYNTPHNSLHTFSLPKGLFS